MQKFRFILNYIHYLKQSKNKFDIHPPFLFDFIRNVLEDKANYTEYTEVEKLKDQLLQNKDRIEVTDLGAGSTADNNKIRSIESITKYSSKPKKYGRLMFRTSRHFQPAYILELGTAMGISTAYLALGNPDAKVTSIEGCPNISEYASKNFKTLGIRNIELITGNFDNVLPLYLNSIPHIDLAFIDGNHKEEATINYFEQCLLKTVNTSCLIFDDIHWSEGMLNAWNYISNHKSVTLSLDLFFMGIVFFRKELSKQHFVIRF